MKRLTKVFPIVVLAATIYFLAIAPGQEQIPVTSATFKAPAEIIRIPQVEVVTGIEAMNQVTRMHGTPIDVKDAYIAQYVKGDSQIILWASESPTSEEGERLFRIMDEKMPTNEVFSGREEVEIGGQKMVKVVGQGMEHYYWVEGEYNYWVGIAGADAVTVVEDLLGKSKFF